MTVPLTRRTWLGQLSTALLAWTGLRPAAAAPAPPACPHPVHQPLCADRPGEGWWFRTRLRRACPVCGETVHHDGYLPDTTYASCRAVPPPGYIALCDSRACVTTYTYDAAGQLWSGPPAGPTGHTRAPFSRHGGEGRHGHRQPVGGGGAGQRHGQPQHRRLELRLQRHDAARGVPMPSPPPPR